MKRVRNKAKPTRTVLGGVWPVPKAWRKMDNTMMMRTNAVIMSKNEGSRVSDVIKANSCSDKLYCCWPLGPPVTFTMGMPCADAAMGNANKAKAMSAKARIKG